MKVKLNYVDVLFITPNDFTKNGSQYIFKTGAESNFFNLVLQTVRNIAASQNFKQFGLRVFSAKGYEQFSNQYLNTKELPAVCFIDFDNPNDAVFRVLTTLNKSEITENRLYELSDYFAALKKENGVYYKKDGSVWADLREGQIDLGKKKPNSNNTEGSDSEFEANKNGEGFLPIYIPALSELSEIIDNVLASLAPNFKEYLYLGIAGMAATGAVASEKRGKKLVLGSIAAYSLYRFYNISKKKVQE